MLCDSISVHEWNICLPASYNKEPQLSTDSSLWSTWGNIKLTTALGFFFESLSETYFGDMFHINVLISLSFPQKDLQMSCKLK